MLISEALEEYLLDQRIRGNSSETLAYYVNTIRYFQDFLQNKPVAEISLVDCKRYFVFLSDREISSVTVQSYIRGLRAFLTWLYENEYHDQHIPSRFKLPKAQRKIIDVLTDEEIRRLYSVFDEEDPLDLRNLCMISLMLDSGLRRHEVASAELQHLHLQERYLIVTGKGNKQRIVPFGAETERLLTRYLTIRNSGHLSLFVLVSDPSSGMTDNALKMLFDDLKERTGIKRLRCHLLRHTFATRYLENGGNIYGLQAILGHTSLEMCKRYVHISTNRLRADFVNFSPLDGIKKESTD